MDFVEGLPKSHGFEVVLVIIDRLTKYAHFLPIAHPYTANSVATLFVDHIFKLHGLPSSIILDRDPIFTSTFWEAIFSKLGVQLRRSTAYHPQTDGQAERLNRCLEHYLRCLSSHRPSQWSSWLPLAEYWYNTSYHSSLKITPFQALYGYSPSMPLMDIDSCTPVASAEKWLQDRVHMTRLIRDNLAVASNKMKQYADKKRTDREFEVGDQVYLRLQPYRQHSVALRKHLKLSSKYYGPFTITRRIGKVAYQLQLPAGSKIHPVFHVSLLKKHIGERVTVMPTLPITDEHGQPKVAPYQVLQRRMINRNNQAVTQWLIRWTNLHEDDATWEDASFIRKQFQTFQP